MSFDTIHVPDDDDGQRLDRWLKKVRPDWPYVLTQKLLRKGAVKIDGKRAKPDARLIAGQEIRLPIGDDISDQGAPREKTVPRIDLDILYEDDDIFIINKPSGLSVQGGSGVKVHLEMMLKPYGRHGVNPRLVHRLDRDTSGVMVIARTSAAARAMGEQFKGRDVHKTYWALVSPIPNKKKGFIDAPVLKVMAGPDLEKMKVVRNGDPAQTGFEILATSDDFAWMEFTPRTGRTHQIRVHAEYIGSPLLGDAKYGGNVDILKAIRVKPRVMLHAAHIKFTHPKTGTIMEIAAPMPDDMAKAIKKLNLED